MPLGTEVGLGLRDIVFDVDPATRRKRAHPSHPLFGSCLLWPNGWMDEDATWYGCRPRPRPDCVRRGPSSPLKRGIAAASHFSSHVYCGHGRPSLLLLSSCRLNYIKHIWMHQDGFPQDHQESLQGYDKRRQRVNNVEGLCPDVIDALTPLAYMLNRVRLVGWCLTSLFSTNTAISGTSLQSNLHVVK